MEPSINIINSGNINNSYVKKIVNKYNDNSDVKLIGKILNHMDGTSILQFYCSIYKSSKINPFSSDINLSFQFIDKTRPYIHILNDFINPTLNDGRNIFYSLTNKHKYKFKKNELDKFEEILDELIKGIKPFLLCLKENIQINVFIYYGEYEIGHIYQINDFLLNKNTIKFYRLIQINGKNEEMKYIVVTQLFCLIFEPVNNDMSLAKLLKIFYLKDINFSLKEGNFYKKSNKTSYMLIILNDNLDSLLEIEFFLYSDDSMGNNDQNKYIEFKNILQSKKNEIDLKKYKIIITNYKPLFTIDNKKNIKNKSREIINESNMHDDYILYISYFEELYNYYKDFEEENIKERVKTFLSNLTYFCVDFITFYDSNPEEVKFYQSKMIKYLNTK